MIAQLVGHAVADVCILLVAAECLTGGTTMPVDLCPRCQYPLRLEQELLYGPVPVCLACGYRPKPAVLLGVQSAKGVNRVGHRKEVRVK